MPALREGDPLQEVFEEALRKDLALIAQRYGEEMERRRRKMSGLFGILVRDAKPKLEVY